MVLRTGIRHRQADMIPVVNTRRAEWPLPKARRSEAGVHYGEKSDKMVESISGRGHGFTVLAKRPHDGLSENIGSHGRPARGLREQRPCEGRYQFERVQATTSAKNEA
jgi:hypothetical protein